MSDFPIHYQFEVSDYADIEIYETEMGNQNAAWMTLTEEQALELIDEMLTEIEAQE